jgi:tripartite-type tricarboxylate transporter receptor subunit TctC
MSFFRRAALAAIAFLSLAAGPAWSQSDWPNRPIKIINPFPAGGGTDTFARPLAAQLTKQLGQTVIIENIGGAGGTLGAGRAAKEAPDGYTFFMGATHHTIAETLYAKLPYSLTRDFAPISVAAFVPNVVVMHPRHDFKTLGEMIAYARANPGRLNYGSAGNGTTHHMAGELFKQQTGINLTHVPYKGAGPLMQDLLAGQVDMAFDGMGTSSAQIKAGKLKPLAVTSAQRSPVIPDVPTATEAGVQGFQVTTWYALWGIRGTPQPIIDRMYAEMAKALQAPELKEIWAAQGATFGGMPPKEFEALVASEIARWGRVVKESGVKIDN